MQVIRFNESGRKGNRDLFVRLTEWEALRLIESLTVQLRKNSPNAERAEFRTLDNEYFSMSVHRMTACGDVLPMPRGKDRR